MQLTVRIPKSDAERHPTARILAMLAPTFYTEGGENEQVYVAVFADLTEDLDPAVRLIGEAVNLTGVRVTVDGRAVGNLTKFWSALLCYRDSLREPDPQTYCARLSARLSGLSGCPDRTCISHCQFICTRCLGVVRETGVPPISVQLRVIATQAEVEWCPNLHLPNKGK